MTDPSPATQPQTLRLMFGVGLTMLTVGAIVCAAGALLKPLTTLGLVAQLTAAGGFAVGALVVALRPPSRRLLEVLAVLCVALLALILGASNAVGTTPFFFLWPVVYLAYFSSLRLTAGTFALMTALVAVAVALNSTLQDPVDMAVGTVSSVGLMSWLVGAMTRRESALRDALAVAANTDALTGLLNRRAFAPYLDGLTACERADARCVVLAILDLDHFKAYNDAHGHPGGDRLLVRFADILRAHAPASGRVARLGGEEFALAFDGVGLDDARACVERILDALRRELPAGEAPMTASAGLCALGGEVSGSDELMRCADRALYEAKAAGRDRVCCAQVAPGRTPMSAAGFIGGASLSQPVAAPAAR